LVTCDASNEGSRRAIEHNCGVLEERREDELQGLPSSPRPGRTVVHERALVLALGAIFDQMRLVCRSSSIVASNRPFAERAWLTADPSFL
jgi:hypothetical protein